MTGLRTGTGLAAIVLAASVVFVPSNTRAADIGVDLHGGTLGFGLGVDAQLSRHVGIRAGFNRFRSSSDWEEDDLDYEARIDFESFHGLLDWHPFGGRFRLTGGIMSTDHRIEAAADVESGDEIGDGTAKQDGRLEAEVEFEDVSPYVGAGWDWRFDRSNLEITLDLGLLAQGNPDVDLREVENDPASDQDLREAEREIEDEWSDYDTYPVAQVGLLYRF